MSRTRREAFLSCHDYILDALRAEMAKRQACRDLSWVDRERTAVAIAANQWGLANGYRHDITISDVEQIETRAVGHSDYGSKLALYITEHIFVSGQQ